MNHAHSKYHPVPTCDNGDLCTNPATVTIVLPGFTPQGNETKHQLLLCETCAALLNEIAKSDAVSLLQEGDLAVKMTRISIPVSVTERDALLVNAERNLRHPRDQARFLLRCALGLDSPTKHETATPALHGEPTQ